MKAPLKNKRNKEEGQRYSYRSELEKEIHEVDEKKNRDKENQIKNYRRIAQEWERKSKVTPWLLIRCNTSDMGLRPLPNGVNHWHSPDITIESSDPLGNPVADEENFIHAKIFNLGEVGAAPVKVDFYWGDPSIGLSAAHMNLIGTEWLEIKSLNAKDVRCSSPWIPSLTHGTHQCLMVNCTNHLLDPIVHPFQSYLDRHCGQRNVTVVEAKAGQFLKFTLKLNNVLAIEAIQNIHLKTQRLVIVADEKVKFQKIIDQALAFNDIKAFNRTNLLNMFEGDARKLNNTNIATRNIMRGRKSEKELVRLVQTRRVGAVRTGISEQGLFMENPEADLILANYLINNKYIQKSHCIKDSQGMNLEKIILKAYEQRDLDIELQVPEEAKSNELIAFHFQQMSNNLPTGGYSILVKVV